MINYRRSGYLLITFEEVEALPVSRPSASWVITSVLSGQHLLTSSEELERIRQIPVDGWVDGERLILDGFSEERLRLLANLAILLVDSPTNAYLERERAISEAHWPPLAAAFHLLNHESESRISPRGRSIDITALEQGAEERAVRFLTANGLPPPAFYVHPDAEEPKNLPLTEPSSQITPILRKRRTCRHFKPGAKIRVEELSTLMRLTMGPVALRNVSGQVELLLKTSPSGGSLHPIEAFPLVLSCESQKSGLYHYRSDLHALSRLQEISEASARRLAIYWAQGQSYAGDCSALVILVARFDRNFWKYRERENSYAVVLQDAGHLSQTFQLVATDLGLGSFYTAAINSEALCQVLNLKYPAQAPIGILGIGRQGNPERSTSPIREFRPYRQGDE